MPLPLRFGARTLLLALLLGSPALGSPAAQAQGADPGARPAAAAAAQEAVRAPAHVRVPSADAGGRRGGDGTAGIVPIALGLLLTGVAVYKHRGLPRGH
jgi:hypothetical protein